MMRDKTGSCCAGRDVLAVVLLLGSVWGLSEVLVNAGIRSAGLPFRAGILVGVGMLTLGIVGGATRRPLALLVLPLIAVAVKQLALPVLGTPFPCGANSCLAIGLQGTAAAGLFALATRRPGHATHAVVGGGAALAAAVPFYFAGLGLAPCNYLLSFARPGGFAAFLVAEGLVWAAFAALAFPLGVAVGARLQRSLVELRRRHPLRWYAALGAACTACWALAALTIARGA